MGWFRSLEWEVRKGVFCAAYVACVERAMSKTELRVNHLSGFR